MQWVCAGEEWSQFCYYEHLMEVTQSNVWWCWWDDFPLRMWGTELAGLMRVCVQGFFCRCFSLDNKKEYLLILSIITYVTVASYFVTFIDKITRCILTHFISLSITKYSKWFFGGQWREKNGGKSWVVVGGSEVVWGNPRGKYNYCQQWIALFIYFSSLCGRGSSHEQ